MNRATIMTIFLCGAGFAEALTSAQNPVFIGGSVFTERTELRWQDNARTETGYTLERSKAGDNRYSLLAELPADTVFYVDNAIDPTDDYTYRLRATNAENGSATEWVSITPYSEYTNWAEGYVSADLTEPFGDLDGDGFSNQEEFFAGMDPTDSKSHPEGVPVRILPVNDGDPGTDENGYAGSKINAVSFAQETIVTVSNQQFISYYRRHATKHSNQNNDTVIIGRRNVGETDWEMFTTDFKTYNINNTHCVISFGIDGDGYMHMSWGLHAKYSDFQYAKSENPVVGDAPIVMKRQAMTGREETATYPKFLTLPDGDLLYLFRAGSSGRGDWFLNRYDMDTDRWAPLHTNESGEPEPLFLGRGKPSTYCFYPDRFTLGSKGDLHLSGVIRRVASSYQSNHSYFYMRSSDHGETWKRSDGSSIALPMVKKAGYGGYDAMHVPELVEDIPENYSLMNESGFTTDSKGNPIIANWWAVDSGSGDYTRQYHIYFHDGTDWHRRTVSNRTLDDSSVKFMDPMLKSSRMGRPVVLADSCDRIIVVYNDNSTNGVTAVYSGTAVEDPLRQNWTRINLSSEYIGGSESVYDEAKWKEEGILNLFYQQMPGVEFKFSSQNNSTPVSILEWRADLFFPPTPESNKIKHK